MSAEARQEEVAALVDAHYANLYRYAYRLSGGAADAEDLTQQAFLTAQEKLDQLRTAENAKAWLFAIVRNTYLKTRRGRRASGTIPLQNIAELALLPDDPPDLTGEEIGQLLAELPDDFRLPLILFYFEDMSYRDIATALELPIGTVMSRLSRGKSHLRQRLTERQFVPSE
ncbi:MAG: RNA polymerase sigma factor [Planctomycetaceae bacterium]